MTDSETPFPFHFSSVADLKATPEEAFAFLDDPKKLSSHMGKSSMMMGGSKMEMRLDRQNGRGVGAEIVLEGKMMGIPLFVREFVIESDCPHKKVWQTNGPQNLIVMDQYRMGFKITPAGAFSRLEVFIDYSLPSNGLKLLLGKLLSKAYAKWCTARMALDAAEHFAAKSHPTP